MADSWVDTHEARATATTTVSRRVRIGWALFALTASIYLVTLGIDVRAGNYSLLYPAVSMSFAVLGVLLTTRRPEHRVSWLFAITGLWGALGALTFAYAYTAVVAEPGSLPGGMVAAWFDNWGWTTLALPPALLLVLMPDGHLASRDWWPVPAAVIVGVILGSIGVSASPTFELHGEVPIDNPVAHWGGTPIAVVGIVGAILTVAGLIAALAAFIVRLRRSTDEERLQLRWVGFSLGLAVPLLIAGSVLWDLVPVARVLPALAFLALPLGITVAILKYRLYEIDLVVNRTLVYGLMTLGVIGCYVAVVAGVGATLSTRGDFLLSVIVTAVVAVCFQPARQRVQRLVNRMMYGDRDDPYAAIAKLGRALASSVQLNTVLSSVVDTIGQTLALGYVELRVVSARGTGQYEVAAAYGSPDSDLLIVPLVHQGATVGELRLAPRPGERLRERDHRLISDLAPQVAAAAQAVALTRELQDARQRIVELREEERRRIRRDLHDGLGPALAGLTFTLEAARNLTPVDVERADALLVSATEQVQTMIGDVRRLIYGLRPPTLDQLGLAASIRALAAQESTSATTVEVEAPATIPPLPAAVEVATYWIAQEALTNVRRHGQAQMLQRTACHRANDPPTRRRRQRQRTVEQIYRDRTAFDA